MRIFGGRRGLARVAAASAVITAAALGGASPAWAAPPVATDQSVTAASGVETFFSLDVVDDDFDPITVTITSPVAHGTLDCFDTDCSYTSTAGYGGPDSFTYQASDGTGGTDTATVTITVPTPTVTPVTNDVAGATALGQAMAATGTTITAASFPMVPATGTPHGTSTALDDFPTSGSTFAILSTGDAQLADDPNDSSGSGVSLGAPGRGDTDFDTSVLRLDLTAPAGVNCLRFDFAFYSDEYPEFVGGSVNDAFVAELDTTTWTTSASEITAPDNFAFGPDGKVLSINSTGATSMTAAAAGPTTYDGATELLRAGRQVSAGPHSLYLSIFDQGDHILDTAVFVDNLRFVTVADPVTQCAEGAVVPTNDPPVAVNDSLTTDAGVPGTVSVLTNDSDPDGDALTVTGKTNGAHGTVTCTSAGSCTYTPAPGFSGPDSFTYTISDGHGHSATATVSVTVTVNSTNTPPDAVDDTLTTPEDTPGLKNVLANDTEADGDPLTVTGNTNGAHGTVACTAAGSCTYTPAADYHGPDSFTYTVSDGHGGTDTATVTVTVTPVNDPPVALGNTLTTPQDTAGTVAVLGNDSDVDGDTLTVTGNTNGAHGTVTCTPAGSCTYTPAADYHGPDSFTYTISDGHGGTDTATVTVTVTPAAQPPAAGDVKIEKVESADPVPVGDSFSYRLVVSTVTSATASNVVVSDVLPSGFKLRNVTTTRGTCSVSGSTLSCSLGDVAAGTTATLNVNGAFVVAGSITNTAMVAATGDANASNNQAVAITTVTGKSCTVIGTFGDDNPLLGTKKADVICGLAGDDRINGKHGDDTIYGNDGDDRLMGLGGDDLIDGGPGTDTVTYAAAQQSVRVNLGLHKATGQGVDTLVSIENVQGSKYDDVLLGEAGQNQLDGGAGDDDLDGRAGADTLRGGPGADVLKGGPGVDKLDGGSGPDSCSHGGGKKKGKSKSC